MSSDGAGDGHGEPPTGGAPGDDLEELLRFVRDARGFDFTGYKRASIGRRVQRRMQTLGVSTLTEYKDLLEADVDEFESLFNTILINLTAFFRDPAAWRYLEEEIVPKIVAAHGDGEPIRMWSVGCASGEEPYSLAMIMAEHLGIAEAAHRVKIYGTDIDLEALRFARSAIYSEKSLASVPEELRTRYFRSDPQGRGLTVVPPLRRIVVFGRHDLTRDPPMSHIDLVACRNTLMYLNAETQAFVVPRLHYALREGGYLFLGRAEMVLHGGAGRFTPVSLRHRIFEAQPYHASTRDVADAVEITRRLFDLAPRKEPLLGELVETSLANAPLQSLSESAFQSGPVAELLVDESGVIIGANDAVRSMFGLDTEDLGAPLTTLDIATNPFDLMSSIESALADRTSRDLGIERYVGPSGTTFELEAHVAPIVGVRGNLLGTSITFVEVSTTTERLRVIHEELETAYEELQSTNEELVTSNEELQSSYEELETTNEELHSSNEELETTNEELRSANDELEATNIDLKVASDNVQELNAALSKTNNELRQYSSIHRRVMDHLPVAIVVLNSRLLVEEWNRAATDLWGLRADEVVGEPFFRLNFGLALQALQEPVRACWNANASTVELELEAVNRLGRPVTCRIVVVPLHDDETAGSAMLVMHASERASE